MYIQNVVRSIGAVLASLILLFTGSNMLSGVVPVVFGQSQPEEVEWVQWTVSPRQVEPTGTVTIIWALAAGSCGFNGLYWVGPNNQENHISSMPQGSVTVGDLQAKAWDGLHVFFRAKSTLCSDGQLTSNDATVDLILPPTATPTATATPTQTPSPTPTQTLIPAGICGFSAQNPNPLPGQPVNFTVCTTGQFDQWIIRRDNPGDGQTVASGVPGVSGAVVFVPEGFSQYWLQVIRAGVVQAQAGPVNITVAAPTATATATATTQPSNTPVVLPTLTATATYPPTATATTQPSNTPVVPPTLTATATPSLTPSPTATPEEPEVGAKPAPGTLVQGTGELACALVFAPLIADDGAASAADVTTQTQPQTASEIMAPLCIIQPLPNCHVAWEMTWTVMWGDETVGDMWVCDEEPGAGGSVLLMTTTTTGTPADAVGIVGKMVGAYLIAEVGSWFIQDVVEEPPSGAVIADSYAEAKDWVQGRLTAPVTTHFGTPIELQQMADQFGYLATVRTYSTDLSGEEFSVVDATGRAVDEDTIYFVQFVQGQTRVESVDGVFVQRGEVEGAQAVLTSATVALDWIFQSRVISTPGSNDGVPADPVASQHSGDAAWHARRVAAWRTGWNWAQQFSLAGSKPPWDFCGYESDALGHVTYYFVKYSLEVYASGGRVYKAVELYVNTINSTAIVGKAVPRSATDMRPKGAKWDTVTQADPNSDDCPDPFDLAPAVQ